MKAAALLLLGRYKLAIEIALFGLAALFVLYEVHRFLEHERGIGRAEVQAKWDKQTALDKDAKIAREKEFADQLAQATKNGAEREQTIRTLSAAAGANLGGLRDTLAAIRSGVPSASIDALGKSTATLAGLLAECSGRYQGVAEKADRHASDVKTLQEAWPRNPPKVTP